jgi:hypothetical protein
MDGARVLSFPAVVARNGQRFRAGGPENMVGWFISNGVGRRAMSFASVCATLGAIVGLATSVALAQPARKRPAPGAAVVPNVVPPQAPAEVPEDHPLYEALQLAYESREALAAVADYTAVFAKREMLGSRMTTQVMDMKFREKPFSVYFKFKGAEAGREVIFVAGKNRGNLLVHEVGVASLAGTISLAPTAPEVMKNTRYPITQAGISNLLETIVAQWEAEARFGEIDVQFFRSAKLGDQPCVAIQSSHPTPRREFKFHMTRLYLNKESKLPVRVEQFGFPRREGEKAPLVEEYSYTNLQINTGLADRDFDTRNPEYGF